ncbi:hypothetical protein OE88DRAFT_1731472 [Heliocybe sulcata]|uniref:Uncharacterized protein n=1 Tax=Heliocybe sulcata TaxID=5364 RepID=A0A5C3NER2_9AGAM|nr:hypothetical protein OE88DRAFT_1731472 [Heliocybe sulcata]
MDAQVHAGDLAKRQGLGGLFSGIFGGGDGHGASTSSSSDLLGLGGLTSGLLPTASNPLSLSLPGISRSSSTTSSTSATTTSTSLTSSSTSTSSSTTTTSSSSSTTSSTPTITPPPSTTSSSSASSTSLYTSTSDGNAVVYTTIIAVPASTSSSEDSGPTIAPKSFFQNKPLEGGVFAIVGVIGLVILVAIATWAIRRKAKDRLHEEALTWPEAGLNDVEKGGAALGYAGSEKRRRLSDSSSGHNTLANDGSSMSHGAVPVPPGIGGGYRPGGYGAPAPLPPSVNAYAQPQQMAYNSQAYGRNLTGPSNVPYQTGYGADAYGPPRLPTPMYDATQSPVYSNYPAQPYLNVTSPPPMGVEPAQKALPRLETEYANQAYAEHSGLAYERATPTPTSAKRKSGMSLLSPVSPSEQDPYDGVMTDGNVKLRKRASSHSRELDPNIPAMPAPPVLPDRFGEHDDGLGAVGSVKEHDDLRVLTVANA